MGKPFEAELEQTISTYEWAIKQDVEQFRLDIFENARLPMFIVGSGGSLSACYFAAELYQKLGVMAKAVTPLELIYSNQALKNSVVLFITASGKNNDILFSYKNALIEEPSKIYIVCTTKNSPLKELSDEHSNTKFLEYQLPSGKDGFLATNSLVAFFAILYKALSFDNKLNPQIKINKSYRSFLSSFIQQVQTNYTFTVLYGGFGRSVAIDIESKLAEAALADVLISDYRNFGHGRHHWFDKRIKDSAIVAIISPAEKKLAYKTLSFIPKSVPVLILESKDASPQAAIELLLESFYFINEIGKKQGIDPGKPGVPIFGRKLFHLNYYNYYKSNIDTTKEKARIAIKRKAATGSLLNMSNIDQDFWSKAYEKFLKKICSVEYGSIVFDYDGTLCAQKNRYDGVGETIIGYLTEILRRGIIIGIATGRGRSVRIDLQRSIPKEYWAQIIVGYYNCSDIGLLSDNDLPNKKADIVAEIQYIFERLKKQVFITEIIPEVKPCQITIEIKNKTEWIAVRSSIIQFVINLNQPNIQILESSHSMDIIAMSYCNKLNIIDRCSSLAIQKKMSKDCLCIGDKGRWPGNDYQLLSSPYSLSVDEVSSLPDSCWNIAPLNIKNIEATIFYLSCLTYYKKGLKFHIK